MRARSPSAPSSGEPKRRSRRAVTVLGGGNGTSAVLRGLVGLVKSGEDLDITAIVATADDGGSSGRIRRQQGGLPPGDLRQCLQALARSGDQSFARLLDHRYEGSGELAGHALGNLVLLGLAEQHGSYLRALVVAGEMADALGRVLPVSLACLRLVGVTKDGHRLRGETRIGNAPATMHRVRLSPSDAPPSPGVIDRIRGADLVVVGPGSLFTSILPVLLVTGVVDAVRHSRGERVMVANLMTQPGETAGMSLPDHLEALDRHVGPDLVRVVLAHDRALDPARLAPYVRQRSEPVLIDGLDGRGERVVTADLVTPSGKVRHDPDRVARALLTLMDVRSEVSENKGMPLRSPRASSTVGLGVPDIAKEGMH